LVTVIELAIAPGQAGSFRVEVVRSPAGEARAEVSLDVEALLARREQLEQAILASAVASRAVLPQTERPLREVGQTLFSALLGSGDIAGRYRASAALASERGEGLQVVLRIETPELADLPWEAMYDAVDGAYVCRRDQLVRHVPVASVIQPLKVQPPLRILGIVSSPRGLPLLDVEHEQQQLARALAKPCAEGLIEVHWAAEATWAALQDLLIGREWHVVHFIGHGDFDASRDEGVLALTREDGRPDMVEADRLVDLLHEARPMPRLVVLNSCSGAATGVNDLFAGTAAALVRGGVTAVAAMQYEISDPAAVAFARGFYTAIANGRGVDDATSSGRVAILGTRTRTLEWVTPVMYLRGSESRLFTLHPSAPTGLAAEAEPTAPLSEQAEPVPRGEDQVARWSWDAYAAELSIPPERINVGQRLVAAISAAVEERGLPWQAIMRKGYVAIQRLGGYNVLVVDLCWNRVPRLAAKLPAEPASLGLTSPFPQLPEIWVPDEREWGWTVAPGTPLPDVGVLIDLVKPFQPAQGPVATHRSESLKAAIQRLASSGASKNIHAAADGLLAMGYELRLAKTTAPGKPPENYLRIMDPTYTAHGIGYLTPTMFSFSRAFDRDRLSRLSGAIVATSSVNFSHVESAQPGLAAARLLKEGQRESNP
jgi:CHAT domain